MSLNNTYNIRHFKHSDAAAIVKYANNPKVSQNLRDRFPNPYTLKDARQWIASALHVKPRTHFAIATHEEAIGSISLELQPDVNCKSAEIGYWLGEPFWGKGIATNAVRKVVEHAFQTYDLVRIYAYVYETNPASAKVLEKAGFSREGTLRKSVFKNGKILDQFLYAILNDDYQLK